MKDWEFSIGFYTGIVIGIRTYKYPQYTSHVLYLPLIDLCLTIFNDIPKR